MGYSLQYRSRYGTCLEQQTFNFQLADGDSVGSRLGLCPVIPPAIVDVSGLQMNLECPSCDEAADSSS